MIPASVAPSAAPAAGSWPPPPAPGDRYRDVPVRDGDRVERRPLRSVRLWGCDVLVDEDGRVRCYGCHRLVDPAELLPSPNRRHGVGLLWESAL
ncbi:hypothetical protein AB0873_09525 [Micromonospora sp. NPDC047707]|uniref:hypothetical protein n=1 Tax=Micromonospora sp. NPDC047707 TaxID=3154498 RepID=UPI003455675E